MPIFDQGYQHWSGELSGHGWRWLAIARHGYRIGMKNYLLRIIMLVAWIPAIALGFMLCLWGLVERKSELVMPLVAMLDMFDPEVIANPKEYRAEIWTLCYDTFLLMELRFSMILVLIVGPSLISQDLRFNALPLYFSRPLRRIDYFMGKLGVIGAFLGMVLIIPSIVAYVLGLLFSLDLSIIPDTLPLLAASVGYGIVMTLSTGLFILALSSLTRNSRYIALFWLAVWFISSVVGGVLASVDQEHRRHAAYRRSAEISVAQPNANRPPADRQREQAAHMADTRQMRQQEWLAEEQQAAKSNWRPMVSYTANLSRIGQAMLNTDAAWRKLSLNKPAEERDRFLLENLGSQYPWYWSAAVILGLMGLSACILNFRIKSLDRLK